MLTQQDPNHFTILGKTQLQAYIIVFICGFISGFTLLIPSNTLNFWLSTMDVDISLIGAFSLVSLPYAINFIWSPIFDTLRIPILYRAFGQRLSWIYFLQILLAILVYTLSLLSPKENLFLVAICAFIVSIVSSSQDTAIGALRSEIITPAKQGSVSGIYIAGYRAGMLLSSSGAILASSYIDWHSIYRIFAGIVLCFPLILGLALFKLPLFSYQQGLGLGVANLPFQRQDNAGMGSFFSKIIISLGSKQFLILTLSFLVLYRLPDNFINAMVNPFLLHTGFDALEIATVGKFFGVIAAILGGLIASHIMRRLSTLDSLFYFGIVHAFAHSMFIVQNMMGHNLTVLFVVMGFESITSGMAMAAYLAFITSLCKGRYRATQYAFLSSMMGLSRAILPGISGLVVNKYGWQVFYFFTSIATIPSIVIILYIKKSLKFLNKKEE